MARHSSVEELMKYLHPNPNLPKEQKNIAGECHSLSIKILNLLPDDSPELTTGLRKLLEAKDCFVRASLDL